MFCFLHYPEDISLSHVEIKLKVKLSILKYILNHMLVNLKKYSSLKSFLVTCFIFFIWFVVLLQLTLN